ncbi:alpha/beta hydrolase [Flavimaricola marinus]|uniref:Dihydrolipoyllysine-residue acetyltransferase component of acetoin cleaving system n=1 Tax=Flavimaricola marinus TaxID=1819565 RepID=A0A238LFT0_9RHOB|nr:alpha/beta fold hydrolase [Flavimaricola marinus]SMY07750.1 Dihydrolipoyllysine-residue acetyltransferase component of acetoin cleaving system [Flavimaricola marinus]
MPLPVITQAQTVTTPRLTTRVLTPGDPAGVPVLFVHGNLSAATWWEETMLRLPPGFRAIAPDLRGYGEADPAALIDATRGLRDFSDDLAALMDEMDISAAHMVGHSLGGGILWQMLADHPDRVLSMVQVAPSSPYGFGACKADGTPCFPDNAGSGAGAVNPEFAKLLAEGATGDETPFHPRAILNTYVWKPPFVPERMEDILASALAQQTGPQAYPGDAAPSENWPTVAPGKFGAINGMAPIYQTDPLAFTRAPNTPPILWIRGADDPICSDASLFDLGTLGQAGAVPGWPGDEVFPPQPMIAQTEAALAAYEANGAKVDRVVLSDCGHSPYLEQPGPFDAALHAHLAG